MQHTVSAGAGSGQVVSPNISTSSSREIVEKADCAVCPIYLAGRRKPIPGYGNPEARVACVGMAPSFMELRLGRPFVGPSGDLLDRTIKACGGDRSDVWTTNILLCEPLEGTTPSAAEAAACRPRLLAELEELRARDLKIVVTLGVEPAKDLLNNPYPFPEIEGWLHHDESLDVAVISTFHPSNVLHGATDAFRDIKETIQQALNFASGKPPVQGKDPRHYVADTLGRIETLFNHLHKLPLDHLITLDVETTGKDEEVDFLADTLVCYALSWHDRFGVAVPEEFALHPRTIELFKRLLAARPDLKWGFHNGKFDCQIMFQQAGIDLHIDTDTMLHSYSIDERGGVHGLKHQSRKRLGAGMYDKEVDVKKGAASTPRPALYKYNVYDATYTRRLSGTLPEPPDFYHNLLIPASNALMEIERQGVKVDIDYLRELRTTWLPKVDAAYVQLQIAAAIAGFDARKVLKSTREGLLNPNSSKQLSHLLYEIFKLPRSRGRNPNTTEDDHLEELDWHPFVHNLREYRTMNKMYGTYVLGILDDVRIDGRIHPDYMLHGTRTGRLSVHRPPLHNMPREKTIEDQFDAIRAIFTSSDDDHIFLIGDYKTLEVWIAYLLSRDPNLLEDLQHDIHRAVASYALRIPLDQVQDSDRDWSKPITFGIMYDRSAYSLANGELQCTEAEAQDYLDRYWTRYPVYHKWWLDTKNQALTKGYVETLTGRRRRFGFINQQSMPHIMRQAINMPIQGTASDVTLAALVRLHYRLKPLKARILFTVHDSIAFDIPKTVFDEAFEIIKEEMTAPVFGTDIRLLVDFKMGSRWGNMQKVA